MTEFILSVLPWLTAMIAATAVIFLISGLDDLMMDIAFVFWRLYRRFFFSRRHRLLSTELLGQDAETRTAILVPAWKEAFVIGRMLENAIQTIEYSHYKIFVGTYPNDPDTGAVVEAVREKHPNAIVHCVSDQDGPTTKADCLNNIMRSVADEERRLGSPFQMFVLHDAEDVVAPLELKVMNHLISRVDVVQLPVLPLEAKAWEFTRGHYMDEFAQLHLKDMRTREWITHAIPSAGVGVGFSRKAIETATSIGLGKTFSEETLTEDYELPLQIARLGVAEAFIDSRVAVAPREMLPAELIGSTHWPQVLPAIRSAFPNNFNSAVRQKTRWIIGIALQGWDHLGWHGGNLGYKYMLLRDRKVLVTNLATAVGYVLVLIIFGIWGLSFVAGDRSFPNVVTPGSWTWYLLIVNFYIMLIQLAVRAICTYCYYGLVHGLLSIPRSVWGNIINIAATIRALTQYARARRDHRRRIPWDKTEHEFP